MYIRSLVILCSGSLAFADLRMASQPRQGYLLRNQGTQPWKIAPWKKHMHYRYYEPSTFGYKGLEHQKRRNYDNFLRSNIDNEQDNRNFNTEDGKDHLPFRTLETSVHPEYTLYLGRPRRILQPPRQMPLQKTVKPGDSMLIPFRWNNPHASEMEVNIWIFEHAGKQPVVVPIRKPSCSGEGHQDNIISFTVPSDFGNLGSQIPGFKGCNEDSVPMCTLQVYSHSVESRQYALGFPIVIPGHDIKLTTADSGAIQAPSKDPWLDLSGLRDICLPALDPTATISVSKPRWARLISDVYNHAYQNSDYSPYSGQQPESISRNLQASAINKMEVGNRGELGKSILTREQNRRLRWLRRLESRVYRNYEAIANKVINTVGNKMQTTGTVGVQQLANCFRCMETGSTTTKRQQTNTYIPSFQLPKSLLAEAKKVVPAKYSALITDTGLVQIYVASLRDLLPFYYQSRHLGIIYQEAALKSTIVTMADATRFKKQDAAGKYDGGKYASTEAKKKFAADRGCHIDCIFPKPNVPNDASQPTNLLQEESAQVESILEEADVQNEKETTLHSGVTPFGQSEWFCVARLNRQQVTGPFKDVNAAKVELNKVAGSRRNRQMICKVNEAGALNPPSQSRRAGFQSYLRRGDVNRMKIMCSQNINCVPKEAAAVKSGAASEKSKSWFCVAHINKRLVSGPFPNVKAAKRELNESPGSSRNRQMVCEMTKDGPKKDPHIVGGQWQVPHNNFAKYWRNWHDINVMNSWCKQNDMCRLNGATPATTAASKTSWFCVPRWHKKSVAGPFSDVLSARRELNKQGGHRGNFQMICEMTKDGAKKDPHKVGGMNQGLATINGFQTYWRGWRWINAMNHMCNANMPCRLNEPGATIEKPLLAGSMGTNTSGKCAACVQFFGKSVHPLKKPHMTPLSKELLDKGGNFLPHNQANIPSNPDDALLQISESASRRRRRSALIQNDQTDERSNKDINNHYLKKVRQHMERAEVHELDAGSFKALDDVTPLPEDD